MKRLSIKTIIAIVLIFFLIFLSSPIWKSLKTNFNWIKGIYEYHDLINIIILIVPIVLLVEKSSLKTIGFSIRNWKKILLTTLVCSVTTLFVVFIIGLFWKQMNQLRLEGEQIYFIGQYIPLEIISFKLLYLYFLSQLLTVALPEEIIYRGYLQSRLNFTVSPFWSIVGSTIFFALAHYDRPLMFVHLILIGPIYGYAFYYSKSIIPSTIAHYLSNLGGIIILKYVLEL